MNDYLLHGRYRLTERIASGGMGEVWQGIDLALARPVAVKLLTATNADDPSFRARFRAEARYAASLSHPGIARVFDYGETDRMGSAYLVMELVDGESLSAILERVGRLTPAATLDIVVQAAQALHAAHQAGIVHRDIKPGNLLIRPDGTTKITDFGIATVVAGSEEAHLTRTGIVMGTALYVSPEQATGATVTASSDIYSLGVVAYECLAGHPPFDAEQPLAIAVAHKTEPVPPLPQDVPDAVAELVLAMLAKTPEGRPETALHVADRAAVLRDALVPPTTIGAAQPQAATMTVPALGFGSGPNTEPVDTFSNFNAERPAGPRSGGHRRRLVAVAAMSMALCGFGVIVAALLTSGHHLDMSGDNRLLGNPNQAAPPAMASVLGPTPAAVATKGFTLKKKKKNPATHVQSPRPSRKPSNSPVPAPSKSTAPSTAPSKSTPPVPTKSPSPTPSPSPTTPAPAPTASGDDT